MSDPNIKIIKTSVSGPPPKSQDSKKINFIPSSLEDIPSTYENVNENDELVEFNPEDLLATPGEKSLEPTMDESSTTLTENGDFQEDQMGELENQETVDDEEETPVVVTKVSDEEINKVVEQYYRKKSAYDQNVLALKSSIMSKPSKPSKPNFRFKQKHDEMRKVKAPCVKCGRAVGTIFKTTGHFETEQEPYRCQYRVLEAKCGDFQAPCKLNVNIELGCYKLIPDIIHSDTGKIQRLRSETIKAKNDLLYDIIAPEDAITLFNEIKQNMDVLNSVVDFYKTRYSNILNNKESDEDMKQLLTVLFEAVQKNQDLCKEYDKNKSIDNLKVVVENYRAIVEPNLLKVRNIKYQFCQVNFDEEEEIYSLVQYKITPKQLEWNSDIFRDSSIKKNVF